MKKMHLLALTTSYPLRPGGNAGLFIQNLYRRLSICCTIDVVCPADSVSTSPAKTDDTEVDIRIHAVRYMPRRWRVLAQKSGGVVTSLRSAPWRVLLVPALLVVLFWRCLVRAGDADLIHANWAVCGAVAGVIGRLRNKPVITTLRGSDVARAGSSWLDRTLLELAVHNSRMVICVSKAMAEWVREQFPRRASDIHTCLNGVDEAFLQVDRTASDGVILRILAVGNLIRLKGFDVLIEAVARARHREQMRVCIVGDGPERKSLVTLAACRGVSSCFKFAGPLPATDMPKQFSEADVFVLSSRSEGRPNVVLEGLAAGLAIISTDLEGVRGMVTDGDNGWLVPIDNADELANALDQAAVNRAELRRRGTCARAYARANIGTWSETARCYETLFRTALTSERKSCSSCAE